MLASVVVPVAASATARRANNAICAMHHYKRGSQKLGLEPDCLILVASPLSSQAEATVSQLGAAAGAAVASCKLEVASCCVANVDCILGAAAAAKQISAFSV